MVKMNAARKCMVQAQTMKTIKLRILFWTRTVKKKKVAIYQYLTVLIRRLRGKRGRKSEVGGRECYLIVGAAPNSWQVPQEVTRLAQKKEGAHQQGPSGATRIITLAIAVPHNARDAIEVL